VRCVRTRHQSPPAGCTRTEAPASSIVTTDESMFGEERMLLRPLASVCAERHGASLDATGVDALAGADEVFGGSALATFGAAAAGAFAGAGGGEDCAGAVATAVFGGVVGACADRSGPSAQVASTSSISFL